MYSYVSVLSREDGSSGDNKNKSASSNGLEEGGGWPDPAPHSPVTFHLGQAAASAAAAPQSQHQHSQLRPYKPPQQHNTAIHNCGQ